MITLRVWIVMITVAVILAGASGWSAVRATSSFTRIDIASPAVPDAREESATSEEEPRFDRFGNEIQNALGDYRVDFRGAVYESHSPDTAVIRLGPPTI